uniref:Uncharacterized protein n=1 Tax=Arundo donax TaxID=35708 RepID=A0A0A9RVM8_ARUDO
MVAYRYRGAAARRGMSSRRGDESTEYLPLQTSISSVSDDSSMSDPEAGLPSSLRSEARDSGTAARGMCPLRNFSGGGMPRLPRPAAPRTARRASMRSWLCSAAPWPSRTHLSASRSSPSVNMTSTCGFQFGAESSRGIGAGSDTSARI